MRRAKARIRATMFCRRCLRIPRLAVLLALTTMMLAACAGPPPDLDLRTVARNGRPSETLACPPGYCTASADLAVGDFPVAPEQLAAIARAAITAMPRTTLLRDDAARGRFVAEQRSAVLRFVDTVWVEVVPRGSAASSVAILSRSNVGYYDFGVNRRRVEGLLADIAARAAR